MIGYYAHHHGSGHVTRLQAIAAYLDEPVCGISLLAAPGGWRQPWLRLARDDTPTPAAASADGDVTAGGVLHWAPRHHAGLGTRMAQLSGWIASERPRLLVVDVSVEVALLAVLCGVPTVVVDMPGTRDGGTRATRERGGGGMRPRTAVVTIAHGRHEHLAGQLWGLARQSLQPDVFIAVAMDDPAVRDVVERHALPAWSVHVPDVAATPSGLPLAAARNAGARAATEAGADRLVFLDVDCIPSAGLVARYAAVLGSRSPASTGGGGRSEGGPVVACGEVGYLAPVRDPSDYRSQDVERLARPHPAGPSLTIDEVRQARDVTLFWSLSFPLTSADWDAIGGFCEDYVGYGGEDTDFGQRLRAVRGTMLWVGGATAYHQHHPSASPPVKHLGAIVANANRFHRRWGWFPMGGWLSAFVQLGLAELDEDVDQWRVVQAEEGVPPTARRPRS